MNGHRSYYNEAGVASCQLCRRGSAMATTELMYKGTCRKPQGGGSEDESSHREDNEGAADYSTALGFMKLLGVDIDTPEVSTPRRWHGLT